MLYNQNDSLNQIGNETKIKKRYSIKTHQLHLENIIRKTCKNNENQIINKDNEDFI